MSILRGQLAVVTGASGGIGGAIARALAKAEANLVLMGRVCSSLRHGAEQLRQLKVGVDLRRCDLAKDDDIEAVYSHIKNRYGRADILVLCAGTILHGSLGEAPVQSMDSQYKTNVRGPLLLTQKLLPLLKKPRGQIVFVNSSTGLNARPNTGQFSATQHAFKALADALRDEVNADGIRVTSIFPGRTATARIAALASEEGREFRPDLLLQPADIADLTVNVLSLPWTAEVTNISIRPMLKSY